MLTLQLTNSGTKVALMAKDHSISHFQKWVVGNKGPNGWCKILNQASGKYLTALSATNTIVEGNY